MKKILLLLTIVLAQALTVHAFYPYQLNTPLQAAVLISAFNQRSSQKDDFKKALKVSFRFLEAGAGVVFGVYNLSHLISLEFLKDVHPFFTTYFDVKNFKFHSNAGIVSNNKHIAGLALATFLVHDGLTNLHKELNH